MSADTTPGMEAERAAFESVFSAPPYEFELARHPENSAWPGSYRSYHVQCAWDAWQEGRRGVTPAANGLSDLEISAHIKRAIPSLIGDAMALRVARAVLARWGAPAASGESHARNLAKRIEAACQGRREWQVMNAEETAMCMWFTDDESCPAHAAQRWLDDHPSLKEEGYHVVERRVFSEAETLALEAAKRLRADFML